MKWTVDEIAVCICALLLGLYFSWYNTGDWFTFLCIAVLCAAISIAIYGVVRAFVSWFAALKADGVVLNPFVRLGLRGTKPYKEAYAALFKTIRQLEEDDDVRFFNYRNVRDMAGYDGKRKNYEMLACFHAWNDIKPLLEPYSKEDASGTLFVGFIKAG